MKSYNKLFLMSCAFLFQTIYLQADEYFPFSYKKPSLKQLCGIYKIGLGGTMVISSSYVIATALYNDPSFLAKKILDDHCYDLLSILVGAHTAYFGVTDFRDKQNISPFLKVQQDLINTFATSCGIKMAFSVFSYLKRRAFESI